MTFLSETRNDKCEVFHKQIAYVCGYIFGGERWSASRRIGMAMPLTLGATTSLTKKGHSILYKIRESETRESEKSRTADLESCSG
jgi:hypothetical protein